MTTTNITPTTLHRAGRSAESAQTPVPAHYKEPDWFTRHIFNSVVKGLTRMGISVWGSRVLEHRGRTTGELHHVPVNLLTIEGKRYLVSPRGQTQWVRNVRHAGGHLVLILGRRRELARPGRSRRPTACRSCAPTCAAGSSRRACSSTA